MKREITSGLSWVVLPVWYVTANVALNPLSAAAYEASPIREISLRKLGFLSPHWQLSSNPTHWRIERFLQKQHWRFFPYILAFFVPLWIWHKLAKKILPFATENWYKEFDTIFLSSTAIICSMVSFARFILWVFLSLVVFITIISTLYSLKRLFCQ